MWYETSTMPAPEGVNLLTKIHDNKGTRNEQKLIRKSRLWWFTDMSMYVYYTPTHWKYIEPVETQDTYEVSTNKPLLLLYIQQQYPNDNVLKALVESL